MTPENELLAILQTEEAALRARDFGALAEFQRQKNHLLPLIGVGAPPETLRAIKDEAERNAALYTTILSAIRGVTARFDELEKADRAVGYGPDGGRLSFGESKTGAIGSF